jgi:hypothetical protein
MKRFGLVVVATATMLAFASPVSAGGGGSTANKQYRALVCPTSNYAVATATCSNSTVSATSGSVGFTFVITNESTQQGLGSAQLTAPAGFTSLASTDGSISACTATSTTACYTSVSGTVIQLNFLGLPKVSSSSPVRRFITTVSATISNGCASTGTWSVGAHQANQYNSATGNDFYLDAVNSSLTTPVNAVCSLRFASDGQPADTQVNSTITNAAGSSGGPVKVEALNAMGDLVTAYSVPITVALGCTVDADSTATLGGTTTQNTSSGVASFGDLTVDTTNPLGAPYCLNASTSVSLATATSTGFNILDTICSGLETCTATAEGGSVVASVPPTGSPTEISFDPATISCGDTYFHALHRTFINIVNYTGQIHFTIRIPQQFVGGTPNGAGSYEACIASLKSFTQLNGSPAVDTLIGGTHYYVGIVPNCSPKPKPDCAHIYKNGGDVIEDLFLAPGDPMHY